MKLQIMTTAQRFRIHKKFLDGHMCGHHSGEGSITVVRSDEGDKKARLEKIRAADDYFGGWTTSPSRGYRSAAANVGGNGDQMGGRQVCR